MPVEGMALRTFVLMWSEMQGNFQHNGCVDHCPERPVGNQSRPLTTVRDQPMECRLERRWNGYGPRTNRQNLSSLIILIAMHSDSHATSMEDCGTEGEC